MPATLLPIEQLYKTCPSEWLDFSSTDELEARDDPLGQERALQAINFAVGMPHDGFNLYVAGSAGLGKHSLIDRVLKSRALDKDHMYDFCYINNFETPHKPQALQLPAGTANRLKKDMEQLLEYLLTALPEAFKSDEYRTRHGELKMELEEIGERAFVELAEKARELNVGLMRTPTGYTLGPMVDNKLLGDSEFSLLSKREQNRVKENIETIKKDLQALLRKIPEWQEEFIDKVRALDQEFVRLIVDERIDKLRLAYQALTQIVTFIDKVYKDIIENAEDFRSVPEDIPVKKLIHAPELKRFHINVLVDNSATDGLPVVYESNPTYQNLMGRIEHVSQFGTLLTDFTLIKSGSLHRANGGYLVMDIFKVLTAPFLWETLKNCMRSKEIRIEPLEQQLSLLSTTTLEPEPFPLDIKIALIGERRLYYLLKEYDPEFSQLFKVYADFSEEMDLDRDSARSYAALIAFIAQQEQVMPLQREAVARIIEQASRIADDSEKLSVHLETLSDLVSEANYWAKEAGVEQIAADHVEQAVNQRLYRQGQYQEKVLEAIEQDVLLIDVQGTKLAQVNGLSVMQLGDNLFGRPTRITATARLGIGRVVDIERESELGGAIHSKGVMILSAFLANRFAAKQPMAMSASLVFEQSYGPIEGDSASVAELCALLSAIADVPLRQQYAITGSVNQLGQVQAIGGVNEKIEGFFDVCNAKELTGEQGVIIPHANVRNLMLRPDIVSACRDKKFHIYAAETIDDAIALLTGIEAGETDQEGIYPEGSFNGCVQARLQEFIEIRQQLLIPPDAGQQAELAADNKEEGA